MVTAKILWHYISTFMSSPSNYAGFQGVSGAKAAKLAEIWQSWVKYEHLVANPDVELARIEAFVQISGLDRKLMEVKVNGEEADRLGRFVPAYRPPKALTQEEHDLLKKYAQGMLDHLGYSESWHAGRPNESS